MTVGTEQRAGIIAVGDGTPAMDSKQGWIVALAGMVGLSVCQSPIVFLSFGVFITPLGETFGWSRGPMSLALSICAVTLAVFAPFVGGAIDRYGARRVILPSMAVFGALVASLALMTPSLWHFYAVYFLIGLAGTGANNVGFLRIVSGWFEKRRGTALGIAATGVALGVFVWPPIAQFVTDHYGWRAAYATLGAAVLCVGLPIALIFATEFPAGDGSGSGTSPQAGAVDGLTLKEALRRKHFWLLTSIAFVMALALNGTQVHFIPLLKDHGFSGDAAAGAFALFGIGQVVARLVAGRLFDMFFGPLVAVGAFLCPLLGTLVLLFGDLTWPSVVAAALLLSIGGGAESDTLGYLSTRYFGLRAFGTIYGFVFAGFMLGTAVSPYFFGATFDAFHSYGVALELAAGLLILLYGLLLALGPYPTFRAVKG